MYKKLSKYYSLFVYFLSKTKNLSTKYYKKDDLYTTNILLLSLSEQL